MASDTAPDTGPSDAVEEIDLSFDERAEQLRGLWWRGLVSGAVAGLVVGLVDAALALRAGN